MKRIKYTLKVIGVISMVTLNSSFLSGQTWVWGKCGIPDPSAYNEGFGGACDNHGNAFISGTLGGNTIFGNDTLFNNLGHFYLVKYDANGNVKWARQSIQTRSNGGYPQADATDKYGNVFEAGYFTDTIQFGSYMLSSTVKTLDAYLVKYDSNGNVLWANQSHYLPTTLNFAEGYSVATDNHGNSYFTGQFGDTVSFGAFTLIERNHCSALFLVKYNPAGNVVWAKQSHDSNAGISAVCTDRFGNIYWAGEYTDSIKFDIIQLTSVSHSYNAFIAKYDSNGNALWAHAGTEKRMFVEATSVTTDVSGNAYITGFFQDTAMFGSTQLITKSPRDIFYAKYDSGGQLIWARAPTVLIDTSGWTGNSIVADTVGNIYLGIGSYSGSNPYKIAFGTDTISAGPDIWDGVSAIVKMDTAGNILKSTVALTGADEANYLVVDPTGEDVYLSGDYWNTVTFGSDILTHQSFEMAFVAKWGTPVITGSSTATQPAKTFNIFPNPSNGKFTIQSSVASGQSSIEVYNVLGEQVYQSSYWLSANGYQPLSIDLSSNPSGIYLYRVIAEDGSLLGEGKIIIQK